MNAYEEPFAYLMFQTETICYPKRDMLIPTQPKELEVESDSGERFATRTFKVRCKPDMIVGSWSYADKDGHVPTVREYVQQVTDTQILNEEARKKARVDAAKLRNRLP